MKTQAPRAPRLNGWQRLWVAAAVAGLAAAAGFVAWGWETSDAWLREIAADPPTRVDVAGAGTVEFPATMSPEAIAIVTEAAKGDRQALAAGIRAWGEAFERVLDTYAAQSNRRLVLRVLGAWIVGVALLYAGGWLVAWVRRGFRPPS